MTVLESLIFIVFSLSKVSGNLTICARKRHCVYNTNWPVVQYMFDYPTDARRSLSCRHSARCSVTPTMCAASDQCVTSTRLRHSSPTSSHRPQDHPQTHRSHHVRRIAVQLIRWSYSLYICANLSVHLHFRVISFMQMFDWFKTIS